MIDLDDWSLVSPSKVKSIFSININNIINNRLPFLNNLRSLSLPTSLPHHHLCFYLSTENIQELVHCCPSLEHLSIAVSTMTTQLPLDFPHLTSLVVYFGGSATKEHQPNELLHSLDNCKKLEELEIGQIAFGYEFAAPSSMFLLASSAQCPLLRSIELTNPYVSYLPLVRCN